MRVKPIIPAFGLVFIMLFSGCGESREKKSIRHLQKKFELSVQSEEKSELANQLHTKYSLYHLHNDSDSTFLLQWAKMAALGKEYEEERRIYTKYLVFNKNYRVFVKKADVNALLGYFEEAGKDYNSAALMAPTLKEKQKYEELAELYLWTDSIIQRAGQNIRDSKEPLKNRVVRAGEFLKLGQLAAAKYDIDFVLKLEPENSSAHFLSGKLFSITKEYGKTRQSLEDYFRFSDEGDSLYGKALELKAVNSLNIKLKNAKNELLKNPVSYLDLIDAGTSCFDLKKYLESISFFDRIIYNYPDSVLGYLYRGQALIQTSSLDKALADIQKALSLDFSNISGHNLKAYIHLLRNEEEKVREELLIIFSNGGEPLEIFKKYNY